jgi:hypothetical protein
VGLLTAWWTCEDRAGRVYEPFLARAELAYRVEQVSH